MMEGWKEYLFDEFVECNPKIGIKRGETVEHCEMEDINPVFKYLYPQRKKIYNGSNSKFQNGDTVFARITPCLENGKIAQIKGLTTDKAIGSTEFFVFRGKKEVSISDFVYYLCKTNIVRDTAVNSMTGASGRQRADLKALKKLRLHCPQNTGIQQKIASILAVYDELIEVNNQQIALLEEEARELYKEWFVRMRFPGYKSVKFVNGVPEGWKIKNLGDILELAYGKALREEERIEGDYPVYGSSGIVGTHINALIQGPVIIVGRKGNVGKVYISFKDCYPIDTVFYSLTHYPLYYVYFLLKDQTFIEGDAAVPGLNRNQAYKIVVKMPDLKLIESFNEFCEVNFSKIENLQLQNQHLVEIRDRLLPRLMSGKLSIKG